MAQGASRTRVLLFLALLLALLSLACFAIPIYIIWPFRHQGPAELSFALFVKQIGPGLSIACSAGCGALVWVLWRRTKRWTTRLLTIGALVLASCGMFLSRINVYEIMFHPVDTLRFEPAELAKLDSDDMVIAVRVNNVSRAYPIREMAYHHVVNDTVGGVPIAATY